MVGGMLWISVNFFLRCEGGGGFTGINLFHFIRWKWGILELWDRDEQKKNGLRANYFAAARREEFLVTGSTLHTEFLSYKSFR